MTRGEMPQEAPWCDNLSLLSTWDRRKSLAGLTEQIGLGRSTAHLDNLIKRLRNWALSLAENIPLGPDAKVVKDYQAWRKHGDFHGESPTPLERRLEAVEKPPGSFFSLISVSF